MQLSPLPSPKVHDGTSDLPLILSIPHSGRNYPEWLVELTSNGRKALESLEDPLLDQLAHRAILAGHPTIIARTPRAAIDLNRGIEERELGQGFDLSETDLSPRAKAGLGLIPTRTASHGELWKQLPSPTEIENRISQAWTPYHDALAGMIRRKSSRHGRVLLLDVHSMPPRRGQAELVIGDRKGTSAAGWITAEAADIARSLGWGVALNRPYAGGEIARRHGRPAEGHHALQLEFDRCCYLDAALREPGPGWKRAELLLATLADRLGQWLAEGDRLAAE